MSNNSKISNFLSSPTSFLTLLKCSTHLAPLTQKDFVTDLNIPQALSAGQFVGITPPASLVKRYHPSFRVLSHNADSCFGNIYATLLR